MASTDSRRLSCRGGSAAVVEPIFGVLKQQRGMRHFRARGLEKVSEEFTLATGAYNITRLQALMAA
jgi:hypothetical protein